MNLQNSMKNKKNTPETEEICNKSYAGPAEMIADLKKIYDKVKGNK